MNIRMFRKKPVEIEAVQFDGTNQAYIIDWIQSNGGEAAHQLPLVGSSDEPETSGSILIGTLEGNVRVDPGTWVARGVEGEFYPIKDSILQATHEPVQ